MTAMTRVRQTIRIVLYLAVAAGGLMCGGPAAPPSTACVLVACAVADTGMVVADNLSLNAGFGTYSIKHLEAAGSSLSAAEIAELFSGKGSGTLAERIGKWSATDISIPEIALEQTIAGIKQKLVYSSVKITDLVKGKIGSFVVASGHMVSELAPGQGMDVAIGSMTGAKIDLIAAITVMSEKAPGADAPMLPLYASFAINGCTIKIPNGQFRIGSITASGIKGRPMAVPFTELMKNLPKPIQPGKAPSPEDMQALLSFVTSMMDNYGTIAIDHMEMHDFKAAFAGDAAKAEPPFDMTINRFGMTGLANFKIGETTLDGVEVVFPTGKIHLGSYAIKGVDFKDYVAGLKALFAGMAQNPQDKPPAGVFAMLRSPSFRSFLVSDLVTDFVATPSPDDAAAPPQHGHFAIARFAITDFADSKLGELALDGTEIAAPAGKLRLGKLLLRGLDYKEMLASVTDLITQSARAAESGQPAAMPAGAHIKPLKLDELMVADLAGDVPASPAPDHPEFQPERLVFTLAGLTVKPALADDGLPKHLSLAMDHFTFNMPQSSPGPAMGIDKLDLSSQIEAGWDKSAQELSIDKFAVDGAGLGTVSVAAKVGNVPPEAFSTEKLMAEAAWLGAAVKSLDVKVDNKGLLQKVLAFQAHQTGMSAEDTRFNLIAAAAVGLPSVLGNSPASKSLANAIAKFLADPTSLHIVATSKDGIGASDAVEPDKILDRVDLKASVNPL